MPETGRVSDSSAYGHRHAQAYDRIYGARFTPGLAVNGLLQLSGRTPSPEELRALLAAA